VRYQMLPPSAPQKKGPCHALYPPAIAAQDDGRRAYKRLNFRFCNRSCCQRKLFAVDTSAGRGGLNQTFVSAGGIVGKPILLGRLKLLSKNDLTEYK